MSSKTVQKKDHPAPCIAAIGLDTSSSGISTPKEHGYAIDNKGQDSLQDKLKSYPKRDMSHVYLDTEGKLHGLSKCKATKGSQTTTNKEGKNVDSKKSSSCYSTLANCQTSRKQPRKGELPVHLPSAEVSQDHRSANDWICKNSACKAVLTSEDAFCKRCSCCICHFFDDNKDPSLWLVCTSEYGDEDCCGLSCHIECALLCRKVGVFSIGQSIVVDGSYCCASCGKVSGILGCWKRQLLIAKDARRVDILCYRISVSYRLLEGTSRFKELHQIVEEAKVKLETEVGPVNGVSAKMARGIVSRLSIASDVQKLCSAAIEKADECLKSHCHTEKNNRDSHPAACRFQFDEITSSSLVIVLRETSTESDAVKGYKLWYCNNKEQEDYRKEPIFFRRDQRRILISNLQPCTEYAFRVVSFTEDGDLGHSMAKCFTKSREIISKQTEIVEADRSLNCAKRLNDLPTARSSGFKVRNLGNILRLACTQEGCCHEFYQDDIEQESHDGSGAVTAEVAEEDRAIPALSRRLDLNEVSVPDLNADVTLAAECFPEEENGCSSEKNEEARLNGSGDSQTCAAILFGESRPDCGTQAPSLQEETRDVYSSIISGSAHQLSLRLGQLDDNYEYCVRVIRWLERLGHITDDFRMKFLTWFSLRSTEQERRVVITFIRTLFDDPSSLAGQLLDSFSEIVACKRLRSGFCSKLWH